ncbi:methyl-accepting chemotaxis protein [Rhizobium sp. GN54]|uniref:methyl-accepting chemotaxis protein n=1 Tax=Rhizobium sp. GN54 TaxID=2898150 RepID=UPI001E3A5D11|nr:methyl-accepting chemotaxis protein [Rhizobium sp. GN54]MCD2183666.1 methyl-accepting chemotaxis protein [Rhizobium sp. GN54]
MDTVTITVIPLAMMAIYFLISFFAAGLSLHNEQAGDNLYYMGFLFTLTSLGVSLYQFTGQASIEDVVRNFGVAISSTIAGISLRILFNQMRRDPVDIERAVRHDLAEMTRRVRTELDTSAMEFSSYRRTSHQMLLEGFEEIARQAEKSGEAVRASIEAMSLQATKTIQEASARLTSTLDSTQEQIIAYAASNALTISEMSDKLNASVGKIEERTHKLADAVDGVIEKFKASRSPDEILKIEFTPVIEGLQTIVTEHSKAIDENAMSTRETVKKVLSAIAPFKQTNATLAALAVKLDGTNAASEHTTQAIGSMLDRLSAIAVATGSTNESMVALTTRIQETVPATNAATEAHLKNADKLSDLISAVKTNTSNLKVMTVKLSSASGTVDDHSKRMEDLIGVVERSAETASKTASAVDAMSVRLAQERPEILLGALNSTSPAMPSGVVTNGESVDAAQLSSGEDDKPKKSSWFTR